MLVHHFSKLHTSKSCNERLKSNVETQNKLVTKITTFLTKPNTQMSLTRSPQHPLSSQFAHPFIHQPTHPPTGSIFHHQVSTPYTYLFRICFMYSKPPLTKYILRYYLPRKQLNLESNYIHCIMPSAENSSLLIELINDLYHINEKCRLLPLHYRAHSTYRYTPSLRLMLQIRTCHFQKFNCDYAFSVKLISHSEEADEYEIKVKIVQLCYQCEITGGDGVQ